VFARGKGNNEKHYLLYNLYNMDLFRLDSKLVCLSKLMKVTDNNKKTSFLCDLYNMDLYRLHSKLVCLYKEMKVTNTKKH
jgi:hypothetical protein